MELFTKKPVTVEASQWFKNGDHPEDYAADTHDFENGELRLFTGAERKASGWEGGVVRYYRHPDVPGDKPCEQCGKPHHVHGWIDTLEQGHRVCPGDWIITGVKGERYPCKPDIFAATYEPAAQPSAQAERAPVVQAVQAREYPPLPWGNQQPYVWFCRTKDTDLVAAFRAYVDADRASSGATTQAVRMLTREELNDVALSEQVGWGPGEYVEAVQRKFAEVNGLRIPADGKIGDAA